MFNLPLSWNSIIIPFANPRKVIYGYQCDFCNKEYSIYITDFKNVWIETLSKQSIIERANSYGLEDTEDDKLRYLLEVLKNGVENHPGKTLLFSIDEINRSEERLIHCKFNGEIEWDFSIMKQSPLIAIDVLSHINFQQFENQNYLNYKIEQLENLINIKDHYIAFLSENYKAINGDQLIKKYRKNNKANAKYLHKYDKASWNRNTENSYKDMVIPKQNNDDVYDRVWSIIERSINDKKSWIFSKAVQEGSSNELGRIKQETGETYSLSEDNFPKFIKKEESESFPRKRPVVRKIGIIGSRKRKQKGSTNTTQILPVKEDDNSELSTIKKE